MMCCAGRVVVRAYVVVMVVGMYVLLTEYADGGDDRVRGMPAMVNTNVIYSSQDRKQREYTE
jgi:hypothetical protein